MPVMLFQSPHIYGIIRWAHDYCWLVDRRWWPHPQEQSVVGIANGPAELDVGRAVAAHARLCQPGYAHSSKSAASIGVNQRSKLVPVLVAGMICCAIGTPQICVNSGSPERSLQCACMAHPRPICGRVRWKKTS